MFSTAELLQQMARRQRLADVRMRRMADTWREWLGLSATGEETGADGQAAKALAEVLAQRVPRPRAPGEFPRNHWQALRAAFRQSFDPPGPDNRRERRIAWSVSALFHVLVFAFLVWLAGLPPPPAAPYGDQVLQVQYIGIGTPEQGGAGAVERPEDDTPRSAAGAPATAASPAAASAPAEAVPPEQEVAEVAAQPLQVTQTPLPDTTFVLPTTTAPDPRPTTPRLQVREIAPTQREIELAEVEPLPTPSVTVQRQRQLRPELARSALQVRERQVELGPVMQAPTISAPQPRAAGAAPTLRAPSQAMEGREVTLAEPAARGAQPAASSSGSGRDSRSGGPPAATGGARASTAAGSGMQPSPNPGGLPATRRGDDWGASSRSQAGGQAGTRDGLFHADGRPRLAPGTAAAGGGFPPGSDGWSQQMLDRHGTWSTRPPNDYSPTRFDQYWIPSGSLLEEWVRRGVRNMDIPIPGTSKRIRCVISMLQLGGGCGVFDPNLQDQPATARPAPDIPWKPELQEPPNGG